MIKVEPATLHLWFQLRQSFVDCRPVTQGFQSCRFPLLQCLFQMEETKVVHIVIEVDVHPCSRIIEQEPTRFGELIAVIVLVHQYGTDGEGSLQKTLDGIFRHSCFLCHLFHGHALIAIAQHLEYAELHHEARHLEDHWSKSDILCQSLSIACRQVFFRVSLLQGRCKIHKQFYLILLMTNAEFVPPNPKELLSTVFISVSMVCVAKFKGSENSSGFSKLIFGATKWCCIIKME